MANRSFEGMVQDPAATDAVELVQFGLELRHMSSGPLLDDRGIETAELRHMKERPGPLHVVGAAGCGRRFRREDAQLRQRAVEARLSRGVLERRPFEQQANGEISASVTMRSRAGTRSGRSSI